MRMIRIKISETRAILFAMMLSISACSTVTEVAPNEGVSQVSGDVYEIFKTDYRGIFGSETSLIDGVVSEANNFAVSKSKVAIPISAKVHRVGILADWAWFYYKFSIVDQSNPLSERKFSEITIERDARLAPEFYKQRHVQDRNSVYSQIDKLNDLRERGVITDAEFQKEKAILLR